MQLRVDPNTISQGGVRISLHPDAAEKAVDEGPLFSLDFYLCGSCDIISEAMF